MDAMDVDKNNNLAELEDQCTCWVCFEIFKEPITLACMHTFCKECCNKVHKKDAQCPFCRRPFQLPLPPISKIIEQLVLHFLSGGRAPSPIPTHINRVDQDSWLALLPEEVMVDILSKVRPKDVASVARTCQQLRDTTEDQWLWRDFALQTSPFCNVERFNRNWKLCFIALAKRSIGWKGGKAGDFQVITQRGHNHFVSCFSSFRNKIYSGSADSTVKIWDQFKSGVISSLEGHTGTIEALQVTETKIASGASDGVRLWDTSTGALSVAFPSATGSTALLLDQDRIINGTRSGEIKVYDVRSHLETHTLTGGPVAVTSLQKDAGDRLISLSQQVLVWDLRAAPADDRIYLGPPPVHNPLIHNIAIPSPTCVQVLTDQMIIGNAYGAVAAVNTATGTQTHIGNNIAPHHHHYPIIGFAPNFNHGSRVTCLQSDGKKTVSGHPDGSIRVYDHARNTARTLKDHTAAVHKIQFDDNKIVTASADNTVKVWNMATGERMYSLLGGSLQARANNPPHPSRPGCSGMVYDESSITASFNALLRVYNFEPSPPSSE